MAVPTKSVFGHLDIAVHSRAKAGTTGFTNFSTFQHELERRRNDLENPACDLVPEVRQCLDALSAIGGQNLVRMSGSGATCFVLSDQIVYLQDIKNKLRIKQSHWWSHLCSGIT